MEKLYRYIKSHRWASTVGAVMLAAFERFWLCTRGWLKGNTPAPPKPEYASGFNQWISNEDVIDFEIVYEEHQELNSHPRSIYAADPPMFKEGSSESIEPGFIARISRGYVWNDGAVLLSDGTLIEDSMLAPERHALVRGVALPRAIAVEGSLGVLSTTFGRGFYHWVFDSLARLSIMEAAGVIPDSLLVNYKHLAFHGEWLEALGVDPSTVYSSLELPFARADTVILTQIPGRNFAIPQYAAQFLRRKLRRRREESGATPRRVFVSRARAASRRLAGEGDVGKVLQQYAIESISFEDLSLEKWAHLLSDAELFVCPEGAGLTNMLFCGEETKVIEIFSHRHAESFGWSLSSRLGLDYYYVIGSQDQRGGVSPADLARTIELALRDTE